MGLSAMPTMRGPNSKHEFSVSMHVCIEMCIDDDDIDSIYYNLRSVRNFLVSLESFSQ